MAPKSPVGLTFIAAVQSENTSYVFYSEPNSGFLCYLKSQIEEKTSPTEPPPYEKVNILVNEQLVVANTTSPQIAAVSYTLSGHDEIRVYYISDQGYLQELCRTDGGLWRAGSLNGQEEKASPKSVLTASIDYTKKGQMKVYFNRVDESAMRCTWTPMGEKSWTTRVIT